MNIDLIGAPTIELWSEINEQELSCYFAESGADREMCFDREKEEEKLYIRLYESKGKGKTL